MWKHWVARCEPPAEAFGEFKSARWFWKRFEDIFPERISAVLMPNHLHLILPADIDAKKKLAGLLGAFRKRPGFKGKWLPIPDPSMIPDHHHLRRQIRYLALNPCRKGLCKDPLEWYWSTYRNLVGATPSNEGDATKIAKVLKESPKHFEIRFHCYVSSDPTVEVQGTPFPQAQAPSLFPDKAITEILSASAAALEIESSQVRTRGLLRSLFIHQAYRHGWRRPIYLAEICGITPSAVHYNLSVPIPSAFLRAADLCLGDARLRRMSGPLPNLIESQKIRRTKAWSRRFL